MKRSPILFASLALALFASGNLLAAGGAKPVPPAAPVKLGDPLAEFLFPPEMVLRAADQIGLDQSQVQTLRAALQEARTKLAEVQQKMATDTAAMRELLAAVPPDEQKCLEQLDKVLDDEKAVKHINLSLMLQIKSRLTPDQIAKLTALRDNAKAGDGAPKLGGDTGTPNLGEGAPESLRAKLQDVRTKATAKQQAGSDISAIKALAQEAQSLAQQGKFQDAEAKLNEALNQLK